jgi:hypothetical protein
LLAKVKNAAIAVLAVLIVYVPVLDLVNYIGFMQSASTPFMSTYLLAELCFVLLACLIICSIDRPFKLLISNIRAWINICLTPSGLKRAFVNNPWRFIFIIIYFATGVIILTQSYLHNVKIGTTEFAILMLVFFPILALAWRARKDMHRLWVPTAWALVSIIPILLIMSAVFTPLSAAGATDSTRVILLDLNSGVLARYIAAGIPGIFYLIYRNDKSGWWALIALPFSIGVVLMSGSRTTLLAILLTGIVFIIALIKRGRSINRGLRYINNRLIAIVLSFVLSLPLTISFLSIGSDFSNNGDGGDISRAAFIAREVSYYAKMPFSRFGVTAPGEDKSPSLDELSSGRIEIWKAYISAINISGHDESESPKMDGIYPFTNAHNAPLTFGFQCGVTSGILYLLLIIMSAIYVMWSTFARGVMRSSELFPCLLITFYFFYSLLDPPLFPFDELPVMMYFLAAGAPLFGRDSCNSSHSLSLRA